MSGTFELFAVPTPGTSITGPTITFKNDRRRCRSAGGLRRKSKNKHLLRMSIISSKKVQDSCELDYSGAQPKQFSLNLYSIIVFQILPTALKNILYGRVCKQKMAFILCMKEENVFLVGGRTCGCRDVAFVYIRLMIQGIMS